MLDVDEGRVPRAPKTCGRSRYTIDLLREYMSRTYSNQFSYDGKLKMGRNMGRCKGVLNISVISHS